MDRSKNKKTVDAHTMHTDSLKSTARSSKPKGTDMRGIKLLRLHNETTKAAARYRRKGEQKVVVQHVNVNDGGKAIIGNMIS